MHMVVFMFPRFPEMAEASKKVVTLSCRFNVTFIVCRTSWKGSHLLWTESSRWRKLQYKRKVFHQCRALLLKWHTISLTAALDARAVTVMQHNADCNLVREYFFLQMAYMLNLLFYWCTMIFNNRLIIWLILLFVYCLVLSVLMIDLLITVEMISTCTCILYLGGYLPQ